jgi:hypothetical protein
VARVLPAEESELDPGAWVRIIRLATAIGAAAGRRCRCLGRRLRYVERTRAHPEGQRRAGQHTTQSWSHRLLLAWQREPSVVAPLFALDAASAHGTGAGMQVACQPRKRARARGSVSRARRLDLTKARPHCDNDYLDVPDLGRCQTPAYRPRTDPWIGPRVRTPRHPAGRSTVGTHLRSRSCWSK